MYFYLFQTPLTDINLQEPEISGCTATAENREHSFILHPSSSSSRWLAVVKDDAILGVFNVADCKCRLTETHERITLSNNLHNNTSVLGMTYTDNSGINSQALGQLWFTHTLPNANSDFSTQTYIH